MNPFKLLALAILIVGLSLAFLGFDACKPSKSTGLSALDLGCFFNYSMGAIALCILSGFLASIAMKKDKAKKKENEITLP